MKKDELEKRAEVVGGRILYHWREATLSKAQVEVIILEALQQVRRDAMEEAAQIAESGKNGDEYTDCVSDLIAEAFRAKAKEME